MARKTLSPPLSAKFETLAERLNVEHVERREEIDCALLALVAGVTFFMLGPPGVAKTMLVRRLHAHIDGSEFFAKTLDKFTTPDDLFGPRSLSAMKQDQWRRTVEGTLVTADFAMLDEFFEASSALLKTLLEALNERTFRQGDETIAMRLSTVFTASNEIPSDPRLAALYDRLLLRRQLRPILDSQNFMAMLASPRLTVPEPVLSWNEVLLAQVEAAQVTVPTVVLEAMTTVRRGLADREIHPSDRRFMESLRVVRAAAWLDGAAEADTDHLQCLTNILWDRPEDMGAVAAEVAAVIHPTTMALHELHRDIEGLIQSIRVPAGGDRERKQLVTMLVGRSRQAQANLDQLATKTTSARHQAQVHEIDAALASFGDRVLTTLVEPFEDEAQAS